MPKSCSSENVSVPFQYLFIALSFIVVDTVWVYSSPLVIITMRTVNVPIAEVLFKLTKHFVWNNSKLEIMQASPSRTWITWWFCWQGSCRSIRISHFRFHFAIGSIKIHKELSVIQSHKSISSISSDNSEPDLHILKSWWLIKHLPLLFYRVVKVFCFLGSIHLNFTLGPIHASGPGRQFQPPNYTWIQRWIRVFNLNLKLFDADILLLVTEIANQCPSESVSNVSSLTSATNQNVKHSWSWMDPIKSALFKLAELPISRGVPTALAKAKYPVLLPKVWSASGPN